MELAQLLGHQRALPSMPRVTALLLTELGQAQPDLRRIDQLLSADPALGLQVLQAANAPVFGLCGQVFSVAEALALLHLSQLQALVNQAISQAPFKAGPDFSLARFWVYCQDCARLARSLAGLLQQNQQAAYSCGLIHALGGLLMRAAMPQAQALDASCAPLDFRRSRAERHAFGFCHTQVSAALAARGGLPQVLCDALANAHAQFDNDAYEPLAGIVHLAQWRAGARQLGLANNALTVTFPSRVADVLGLDIDMVLQQDPIDWHRKAPGLSA